MQIKDFFNLIRIKQYSKNFFLFAPAFFAAKLTNPQVLLSLISALIAFSLVASSVYIFNDLQDRAEDKKHPEKNKRPLVTGAITAKQAKIIMVLMAFLGLGLAILINFEFLILLIGYSILMVFYSWKLKHIALIDVFIIALGFVMRILAGGIVAQVFISSWLIITTFLLALFLALTKRRADLRLYQKTGTRVRKAIEGYNQEFLDAIIVIMAVATIIAYLMYTFSPQVFERFHTDQLYITGVFVVFGILRYLQLAFVYQKSVNPSEVLLTDRILQVDLILWLATFAYIIY